MGRVSKLSAFEIRAADDQFHRTKFRNTKAVNARPSFDGRGTVNAVEFSNAIRTEQVLCSANVESVVFVGRFSMRKLTTFRVLSDRAVGNEGIFVTMGLVPIER